MTRKVQVHQVDAFTREPFTGNPTGVVLNADSLSEAQMLAIARELNNAETAFILAPDADDHTVRARFFTPRSEAGFVGHATIAAQYVLSRRHDAPRWQRQKSKAGIVDVEVRGSDEDRRIAIRRSPPPIGRELNDRTPIDQFDVSGPYDFGEHLISLEEFRSVALAARPDRPVLAQRKVAVLDQPVLVRAADHQHARRQRQGAHGVEHLHEPDHVGAQRAAGIVPDRRTRPGGLPVPAL